MSGSLSKLGQHRRGAIAVLAALLCVILMAMLAFAVDIGYLGVAKTQLQATADSAALAAAAAASQNQSNAFPTAQYFASHNRVAGRAAQINSSSDVQFGTWDTGSNTFTPSASAGNAVKVTVRADGSNGGQVATFFGKLLGVNAVTQSASAIACMNPRDIAFVVDLSGSMNDDTDPSSSTFSSSLAQNVYNDFGFGAYPGTSQTIASALGGTSFSNLQSASGLLHTRLSSSSSYYIKSNDGASTRLQKATSYLMAVQMASIMPHAIPTPNSSNATSRTYWADFFGYLDDNGLQLGYKAYLQYMMYNGRDVQPDGTDYTPLSLSSNLCTCPQHSETVGTQSFNFPPREMPTHAMRRALISAIQIVQSCNQSISDSNQMDWVSIITFDKVSSTSPKIQQALTSNYTTVMTACTRLQAVTSNGASTNTEAGMALAYSHIKPQSQGGAGRENTNKIVILLTDGGANLMQSLSSTVANYVNHNPNTWTNPSTGQTVNNWTMTGSYQTQMQAALMQTAMMQAAGFSVYAAGVGDASDDADATKFLNSIARMGGTADSSGNAPCGGSDPATYEANVTAIFQKIITNPKLRIVQ